MPQMRVDASHAALEHCCLVLTNETFGTLDNDGVERESIAAFQHNTERMLELAHEALILLSLAMHEEEMQKRRDRKDNALVVSIVLPAYRRSWESLRRAPI